jgi:demethylmenaquinone methyltransferase/2-methoxy-6-polyprenyl-1,4-benzoquinol methylase
MERGASLDLEPARVAALFDRNATTYDAVNSVLTFGLDARWRRWAARQALASAPGPPAPRPRVLDACAGTGLLALELARLGASVTAADVAPGMLARARERAARAGLSLETAAADLSDATAAAALPGPFDAVTLGFGLRYFADPGSLLRPLRELLKPDGRLVVVEAVRPPDDLPGRAAGLYFFHVAPNLGAALAGHGELYRLLRDSTSAFGSAENLASHLRAAGFSPVLRRRFAAGSVTGIVARRV